MEAIAYRTLFFPIFFISVIFSGFLFCLIIVGFDSRYIIIGLKTFSFLFIPFILLLIFKIRKPKILISKNKNNFVIHYYSKDLSISFNEIKNISYDSLFYSSTIIIKTNSKKYRIRDIKKVGRVYKLMLLILDDNKIIQ